MVSCWSQCTPIVPFKNQLFACFIFHFKNRHLFLETTLTSSLSLWLSAEHNLSKCYASLCHSPRQIKCSVKALIWKRFVYFRHNVSGLIYGNIKLLWDLQRTGLSRLVRPICSLIGQHYY